MQFNMEDLNPGTWFFFNEEDEKQGRICIRVADVAKIEEIERKTEKKFDWHNGKRVEVITDKGKVQQSKMLWDYCIVAWEGVHDDNGNEIECTPENKLKLMKYSPVFMKTVTKFLKQLDVMQSEYMGELEGN